MIEDRSKSKTVVFQRAYYYYYFYYLVDRCKSSLDAATGTQPSGEHRVHRSKFEARPWFPFLAYPPFHPASLPSFLLHDTATLPHGPAAVPNSYAARDMSILPTLTTILDTALP